MTAETVALTIEASDSPRLQRQKQEAAKNREYKEIVKLKKEKEAFELEKPRIKYDVAHSVFKDTLVDGNGLFGEVGIKYEFPKFSRLVEEKIDKKTLKVLLVERSKKANWLELSEKDKKDPKWITLIKKEYSTKFQLLENDEKPKEENSVGVIENKKEEPKVIGKKAKELLDALKKYSLFMPVVKTD